MLPTMVRSVVGRSVGPGRDSMTDPSRYWTRLKAAIGRLPDEQRSALRAREVHLRMAREQREPADTGIEGFERRRLAGRDSSSAQDHQGPADPIGDLRSTDRGRSIMKRTIIWALVVGAVGALVLVVTAVSLSASGFQLDVERWVLIGAFLVVISMATAVMVSVLNTLKDVRQQTAGDTAGGVTGNDSGNTASGTSS